MISLEVLKQVPLTTIQKVINSWEEYANKLEEENKKLKTQIEELEEDLDRKENYVYHARDRSRED